jgi:hypothetical protein
MINSIKYKRIGRISPKITADRKEIVARRFERRAATRCCLQYLPVDEGPLGVHEVKLVVEPGPGLA